MNTVFICSVSSRFPENYELGIRAGLWGVEEKWRNRVAGVRPGDTIVFVVGGRFRSIHRITSEVFHDRARVWPVKDGDPFPHRMRIGPPEVVGSVPVADLAPHISFMRDAKAWGGTLQGGNGVFNSRAKAEDLELIRMSLLASGAGASVAAEEPLLELPEPIVRASDYWWPGLLDRLAELANLRRAPSFPDPYGDAQEWRSGLLTGVFTDAKRVLTLAIAPFDRSPSDTVLSTLYGLSAVKQTASEVKEVRGVIFVQRHRDDVLRLTSGLANLTTYGFDVQVALRA